MSFVSPNFDVKSIIFSQFWPGAFSQNCWKKPLDGILHILWGHKLYFPKTIVFLSPKMVFVLANSADDFESAYHIFFTCPLYAATRRYLPANLHEYFLKDLLYGTENGTSHENETLFLKVQDFLTKCGRFNPR